MCRYLVIDKKLQSNLRFFSNKDQENLKNSTTKVLRKILLTAQSVDRHLGMRVIVSHALTGIQKVLPSELLITPSGLPKGLFVNRILADKAEFG